MTFTQIPQPFAPLGGELLYTFRADGPDTYDVRILDAGGRVVGARRFVGVAEATLDMAPFLRRTVRFSPAAGGTGTLVAGERTVTASAEVGIRTADGWQSLAVSPARTFLAAAEGAAAPALLTTMPLQRIIGPEECDELTLLTGGPAQVTVEVRTADSSVEELHRIPAEGLHLFRIDLREFPGAEHVRIEAEGCRAVEYVVVPTPEGAQRLAWRSRAGSVEHYTFPVVRASRIRVARRRASGPEGPVAATIDADRMTVLVSAYEKHEVLDGLAGILYAPEVWLVREGVYEPVELLTDQAVLDRHGAMNSLEITYHPIRKTPGSWN